MALCLTKGSNVRVPLEFGALRGEDVFVVASGPSLLKERLALLKGKVVLGYGSIILWQDFPVPLDLYGDRVEVYEHDLTRFITRLRNGCEKPGRISKLPAWGIGNAGIFAALYSHHPTRPVPMEGVKWLDVSQHWAMHQGYCGGVEEELGRVGDARYIGSAVACIQPAIWLRPKRIFLLGHDFTPKGQVYNTSAVRLRLRTAYRMGAEAYDQQMGCLQTLKAVCDSLNIEIINLSCETEDSILPRARLEDVV